MDIRDKIITGTFAIGTDGKKEPTNWKDYSLKLESFIEQFCFFEEDLEKAMNFGFMQCHKYNHLSVVESKEFIDNIRF